MSCCGSLGSEGGVSEVLGFGMQSCLLCVSWWQQATEVCCLQVPRVTHLTEGDTHAALTPLLLASLRKQTMPRLMLRPRRAGRTGGAVGAILWVLLGASLLCTMVWLISSHAQASEEQLSPSLSRSTTPPRVVLRPTNPPPAPDVGVEREELSEMTIEPLKQPVELMVTAPPAPEVSMKPLHGRTRLSSGSEPSADASGCCARVAWSAVRARASTGDGAPMQGVDVDMHKNTEFWGDVVVPGMGRCAAPLMVAVRAAGTQTLGG